ncbi:ABC transporter permease [Streptomyces caatingaensis]|uniref:ABC transporter ATPase n=1 Tax=Streptomyces caatingaensis TaxID=1678637 RepID=A0A0K9XFH4_9ACTN|nr:ABC transporter permease [Streptomyces caatingaensis]KNB51821.1 ABC transporter ATPase [Streptomyces caatingaensis]
MRRVRPPLALVLPAAVAVTFLLLPLAGVLARTPWPTLPARVASPEVGHALTLSLTVSGWALLVSLVLGVPLAWLLARTDFPGKAFVRCLVMLPMVLPPTVAGVALLQGYGRRGLAGGVLADWTGVTLPFSTAGAVVASAFVAMPFLVISLEGALAGLHPRYEETALTLGASPLRVFRTITLPMIAPGLLAGSALCWARALGEFGATITFAGNLPGVTQTLPLQVYLLLQNDPEGATALSLLLLAIATAVLLTLRGRWTGTPRAGRPAGRAPARRSLAPARRPLAPARPGLDPVRPGRADERRSRDTARPGRAEERRSLDTARPAPADERRRRTTARPAFEDERRSRDGARPAFEDDRAERGSGGAGGGAPAHRAARALAGAVPGPGRAPEETVKGRDRGTTPPTATATPTPHPLHTTLTGTVTLTLTAPPGTTIAVVGPNGAGKTTLLRALLGLTPRATASPLHLGTGTPADVSRLPTHHRRIAWVPQDGALFPHLTAAANVAYGPRAHGVPRREALRTARAHLDELGVGHLAGRRPDALSGGQAQRVALARALAAQPELLLLDEPLAALDQSTKASVRQTLRRRLAGFGGVCLLVTHDPVEAVSLADRVLVLEDGAAVQYAPPEEVAARPRSPWVARMLGRNAWPGTPAEDGTLVLDLDHDHDNTDEDNTGYGASTRLTATTPLPAGTRTALAVADAEAVTLHTAPPDDGTDNTWPGTVQEITAQGGRLRIRVAGAGPETVAELPPGALGGLAEGARVWVTVPPKEITLIPRDSTPYPSDAV